MERRMLYWLPLKWRSVVILSVLAFPKFDLSIELLFLLILILGLGRDVLEEVHNCEHR